jgi:hypothetical protein
MPTTAHTPVTEQLAMCRRVARARTRASFDSGQKNRPQTDRRSAIVRRCVEAA